MSIGLGFIGAGNHALHHLKEFDRLPEADPRVITDLIPDRAAAAAAAYPSLRSVTSAEALLKDPEVQAVVVATPAETHLDLVDQIFRAGKHLLLEKPMANTPEAAREIARMAAKHPEQVLLVAHGERFNKPYLDARKAIDDGHIGEPRFLSATRISPLHLNNANWTLGVMDTAIHDMDIMLWLMGDDPVEVSAQSVRVRPDYPIPDHATYQIRFARGGLAQGHIGWVDFKGGYPMKHNAHPRLFAAGTRGTIQLDLWQRPVAINNQSTGEYFWADDVLVGYGDYLTQISAQNLAFLRAVCEGHGNELPLTPIEAARAVQVAHAAAQSLSRGTPVAFSPL